MVLKYFGVDFESQSIINNLVRFGKVYCHILNKKPIFKIGFLLSIRFNSLNLQSQIGFAERQYTLQIKQHSIFFQIRPQLL